MVSDAKETEEEPSLSSEEKLLQFASNGDEASLSELLKALSGLIDLNCKDDEGSSPMIIATCFGHSFVISQLIDAGADIEAKDNKGWTPLFWAITNGHDDCAKLLVNAGILSFKNKSRR
jgi:ankyrin repeat protein